MLTTIYRSAAAWTVIGLVGGLYYRELTKANDVTGGTQLALLHTHALTLGTTVLLVLLALVSVLRLEAHPRLRLALWVYQGGVAITAGMLTVKGTMQVLDVAAASSPAVAGIAGLGHITLTAGLLLLFLVLRDGVRSREEDHEAAPVGA